MKKALGIVGVFLFLCVVAVLVNPTNPDTEITNTTTELITAITDKDTEEETGNLVETEEVTANATEDASTPDTTTPIESVKTTIPSRNISGRVDLKEIPHIAERHMYRSTMVCHSLVRMK